MSGRSGISWAGLAAGPSAWAVSTQVNYALAAPQCLLGVFPIPWLALLFAVLALGGTWLSLLAYRQAEAAPASGLRKPRTEVFLALVGIGAGLLFAAVILLQAYAGMVFTGCER